MDGNRRYAERQHVDKATGHTHGYGKMVDVIHWCMELGVKYITVYAFSIDNFKRSPDEVGALMRLAEEKYAELAQDNGLAEREGIRMRIVGDLQLPPPAVQGAAARLMRGTDRLRSRRATLNVCFSYTASEETVAAVHELQSAVRSGRLQPDDVTPGALAGALRTGAACPPVDLLIRTSGETRLSDFLLWQASHAHLCYLRTLWPNLSYWDFARCVLSYQRHAGALAALRRRAAARLAQVAGGGPADEAGEGRWQQQQRRQADGAAAGVAEAECGDAHNPEPDGVMAGQDGGTAVRRSCGVQPSGVPTAAHARDAALADRPGAAAAVAEEEEEEETGAPGSQAAAAGGSTGARRRHCGATATASTASVAAASTGRTGSGERTGCGSADSSAGRGGLDGPARPLLRQQQPIAWFRSFWSRWWRWQWPALGAQLHGWSGRRRGCRGGGKGDASPAAAAEAAAGGGGGGGGAGGEVRLLCFFEGLEQARVAWIATHADL